MADINLRQAQTSQAQSQITYKDLDCMVNWLHQFALEDDNVRPFSFIFRNGMPQQFALGEWGYTITGDMGMTIRPTPKRHDHRVSARGGTPPEYQVKLGSFYEVISKYTEFRHLNKISLKHPYRIVEQHLAALSRTIPNYLSYLCYKMFVGTEAAKKESYLKGGIDTYIEPADGNTNGYKFYLSEGFETVNLSEIITKTKVTVHNLKTKLENINKALRDNGRKVEVDKAQNLKIKTAGPKNNMTEPGQKMYALFDECRKQAREILDKGRFDVKYKHKNQNNWEGFVPKVSETGGLICLINKNAWEDLLDEIAMSNPVTDFSRLLKFPGTLIPHNGIDKNEAIMLQVGLIQSGIPDEFINYGSYPHDYPGENTVDYIYELAHTIDLVDVFCSMYLKLKD